MATLRSSSRGRAIPIQTVRCGHNLSIGHSILLSLRRRCTAGCVISSRRFLSCIHLRSLAPRDKRVQSAEVRVAYTPCRMRWAFQIACLSSSLSARRCASQGRSGTIEERVVVSGFWLKYSEDSFETQMATNDKWIVGGSAAIRDGYTTETLSLMAMMNSDNDDGHEDDEDDDGDDDDNDDNDQHMDRGRFGSEQVRVHHRNSPLWR